MNSAVVCVLLVLYSFYEIKANGSVEDNIKPKPCVNNVPITSFMSAPSLVVRTLSIINGRCGCFDYSGPMIVYNPEKICDSILLCRMLYTIAVSQPFHFNTVATLFPNFKTPSTTQDIKLPASNVQAEDILKKAVSYVKDNEVKQTTLSSINNIGDGNPSTSNVVDADIKKPHVSNVISQDINKPLVINVKEQVTQKPLMSNVKIHDTKNPSLTNIKEQGTQRPSLSDVKIPAVSSVIVQDIKNPSLPNINEQDIKVPSVSNVRIQDPINPPLANVKDQNTSIPSLSNIIVQDPKNPSLPNVKEQDTRIPSFSYVNIQDPKNPSLSHVTNVRVQKTKNPSLANVKQDIKIPSGLRVQDPENPTLPNVKEQDIKILSNVRVQNSKNPSLSNVKDQDIKLPSVSNAENQDIRKHGASSHKVSINSFCLSKLLKKDVPTLLLKLQELLCLFQQGKDEKNEELYKEFLKQLNIVLKSVGCSLDEVLGTTDILEQITDNAGIIADRIVFEILKIAGDLKITGPLLNVVCKLLGKTLTGLSTTLAGMNLNLNLDLGVKNIVDGILG